MRKTLLLVLAGLVGGLALATWLQPGVPPLPDGGLAPSSAPRGADSSIAAARLAALEDAFAAEVDRRAVLEERVEELQAELEALGERAAPREPLRDRAESVASNGAPAERPPRMRAGGPGRDAAERRTVGQLIAAGFPPDRAEWIDRRAQELRMAALQAQYDATRAGRPFEPRAGVEQTLRSELGDSDYERYLQALGRPTGVGVRDVLASSPAEVSGLRSGDQIVAYDGKRVFDLRELNALTLEGSPGESVVVNVVRDGQTLTLVMPRGPIGIFGGGFRGR